MAAVGEVLAIQCLKQVKLGSLLGGRQVAVGHVANDPVRIDRLIVDVRALIDAGQKAIAPQLRADDRFAGTEHDEARQILVLRTQAEGQPRAQAGPDRLHVARVHHQERRLVIGIVGVHRADHADLVDATGDMWK